MVTLNTATQKNSWTPGKGFGRNSQVISPANGNTPPLFLVDSNLSGNLMFSGSSQVGRLQLDSASAPAPMAVDSFFPANKLTTFLEPIEQMFPATASEQAFRVDRRANWTKTVEHYTEKITGEVGLLCCSKFPRVDVSNVAKQDKIYTFGSGYSLCFDELMDSEQTGWNKEERLMQGVYQVMKQYSNRLAFLGEPGLDLWGIFNNPLLGRMFSPYTLDRNQTSAAIKAVLDMMITVATRRIAGTYKRPNAVILPPTLMAYLNSRGYDQYPQVKILSDWLTTNGIQYCLEDPLLETAGVGGTRAMVLYNRDPRNIERHRPISFGVLQPFWDGVNLEVNCIFRAGSTWVNRTQEMLLISGV